MDQARQTLASQIPVIRNESMRNLMVPLPLPACPVANASRLVALRLFFRRLPLLFRRWWYACPVANADAGAPPGYRPRSTWTWTRRGWTRRLLQS